MTTFLLLATGALTGLLYSTLFEWFLHKYFMHRPVKWLYYPYQAHTISHHRLFRADDTYHLQDETLKRHIPMVWWAGPAIIALTQMPFFAISLATGFWSYQLGCALVCITYFSTYEYIHFCMHLPRERRMEKSWVFQKLNGHHILHHRYMGKNFNVVMPLADLLMGTLLLRSPLRFAQARGPAVPDVQPRNPDAKELVEA